MAHFFKKTSATVLINEDKSWVEKRCLVIFKRVKSFCIHRPLQEVVLKTFQVLSSEKERERES